MLGPARALIAAFAAAAFTLAWGCTPAWAADPYEPNDTAELASGPIPDGTITASLDTTNDDDYYRLQTTVPNQKLTLTTRSYDPDSYRVRWFLEPYVRPTTTLLANDGFFSFSEYGVAHPTDPTLEIYQLTIPEPGMHYLVFSGDKAGVGYSFTLSRVQPLGEPNDTHETATPASAGQDITAIIDAVYDTDTYAFTVPNDNMIGDVSLTYVSGVPDTVSGSIGRISAILRDRSYLFMQDADTFASAKPDTSQGPGATASRKLLLKQSGTYYLSVDSEAFTGTYRLRLTLTGGTPPPATARTPSGQRRVSARCANARFNVRQAKRKVSRARARLRSRPTRARKRAYRRATRTLTRHRASVRRYC